MLIVFEGADAVGKATMSTRLTKAIKDKKKRDAVRVAFPRYETPLGKAILRHLKNEISVTEAVDKKSLGPGALKDLPDWGHIAAKASEDAMAFQCMMVADKYHAIGELSDRLKNDAVDTVFDRYWQSAYAFGAADGLDEDWLMRVHACMPRAEVNIFLDLDPAVSAQRRPDHRDRYEKDRAKQVAVRANYRKLWGRMQIQEPDDLDDMQYATCWHIVDASPPMDEVFAKVWQIYEEALDTYG